MAARTTLALLATLLVGCNSMYYATMEKFGVQKREILADRVEDGREDQMEAQEQFTSALEAFKATTAFEGSELQTVYDTLETEYERCADEAEDVRDGIADIEHVADALFAEWTSEIETYSDPELQQRSIDLRDETRARYADMLAAMTRAEATMTPVLAAFRDQVMFLKHNLNAQAVAALQDNVIRIEDDVAALVEQMAASIAEADAFLASLG